MPPRAEVRVDLADRVPGRAVALEAAASDGRHARVFIVPGKDPVTLEFPAPVRPAFRPTKPSAKASPKPPIPASPYKK